MFKIITTFFTNNSNEIIVGIILLFTGYLGSKIASYKFANLAKPINFFLNLKVIEFLQYLFFYILPVLLLISTLYSIYQETYPTSKQLIVIIQLIIFLFLNTTRALIEAMVSIRRGQNEDLEYMQHNFEHINSQLLKLKNKKAKKRTKKKINRNNE